MSDALLDLAVCLTSLKDWLKEHASPSFTPATVESYVAASTALSSFRDIANSDREEMPLDLRSFVLMVLVIERLIWVVPRFRSGKASCKSIA
jgi:hypothetical protein